MRRTTRRSSPASTSWGILLIALGAVLTVVHVPVPEAVDPHVSVPAIGLILVWSGVLLLAMKAYLYRPRRPRRGEPAVDDWYEHDVRAPGAVGGPTTRGNPQRRR
jgi:hypothetical protein